MSIQEKSDPGYWIDQKKIGQLQKKKKKNTSAPSYDL